MPGMESFDLKCRYCGAPLSKDNIIAELSMASCAQCRAVSGFKGVVPDWSRDPVALPEGFRVEEDRGVITIFYDGGGIQVLGLAFIALFGVASLLFSVGLRRELRLSGLELLAMGAAQTLALGFAALDATGLLKRLQVKVSKEKVEVLSGPMSMSTAMSARHIVQFLTREVPGKESRPAYEVVAVDRAGSLTCLIGGLPEAPQALYIEQRIERALGLKDVPMPGEVPRAKFRQG